MGRRLLIVIALGAIVLLAASASALARTATVTIVPAAGPPGTTVTVIGAGFPARRRASIKLGGAGAVKLRASRRGAFVTHLTVPTSALGNLNLVSRTKGRRVLNRFAVATGTGPVSEISTSRGQRLRWSVGASAISLQGRGFKKRARLKVRWLGRTVTLRTNRRGRFLTSLTLPTSGSSHPALVRIGALRLRFLVVGSFGSGGSVGGAAIPAPPPLTPGTVITPATPQAPQNNQPPTIAGGTVVGATVVVDPGSWTATPPVNFSYQWRRCSTSGSSCSDIGGATGQSYATTSSDEGKTLRAVVTATNSLGSASATSAQTATIATSPTNTALPKITGTASQGSTLKTSTGTWSGTKPIAYTYQWQRCDPNGGEGCSSIPSATSSSYKTGSTDVGSTLNVIVAATNSGGTAFAVSAQTAAIQPPPPTSGVVAQWNMNSTGAMTDSAGGHNGTTHSVGSDPLGFSGAAYSFNGSSSYVNVPSGSGLNPGSSNITITIHFKTAPGNRPPPQDWDLIRKGLYVDGAEYKMEYYPSGQVGCAFRGDVAYTGEHPAGPTVDDGNWHTIQCKKTSTGYSTIVDGNPVYSANITIGSIANGGDVVIGARPGSEFFTGSLDEASITLG